MVDPEHPRLSIVRQCALVSIARSSFDYQGKGESPLSLALMHAFDEQFLETPWYGARQMAQHLKRLGYCVGRKRVRRLMRLMGLAPIYQKPRTSDPNPGHRVYPYLLRGLEIDRAYQVWCSDITYIPMRQGFLYLAAIMDWWSGKVLSRRLSNTLEPEFCVYTLEEALARYGRPEIFNTDQGSQFTRLAFTQTLKDAGVKISMDGRGRWMDNVMIERLWRSLKYECIYLQAFKTGAQARSGIGRWIDYYDHSRPHSVLAGSTPEEAYHGCDAPSPGHPPETAPEALGHPRRRRRRRWGVTFIMGSHLTIAAKLSNDWGPPPIGEVRPPIPAEPRQLERFDFEDRRNGTVNLFVVPGALWPWRQSDLAPIGLGAR